MKFKGLVSSFLILLFVLTFSGTPINAKSDAVWYSIGSGPLRNEVGFPTKISTDGKGNLYVLDGLKSCITIFDQDSKYKNSFPIYLPSGDPLTNVQLCISLDNQIFLRVNAFMYIYNQDGSIKKTFLLNNIPGFAGLIGNKFSPIYENTIVFKENASSNCWIGSLDEDSGKQPKLLTNDEGIPVTATDISSYNDTITILNAPFGDLSNSYTSLFNFDTSGNFISSIELNFLNELPTSISYSPDGYICLLCSHHYFYILDPKSNEVLAEGSIDGLSWNSQYLESFSFCGKNADSVLIADPHSGILIFKNSGMSTFIPLAKNKDSLAPSRVTGDKLNIFSYDYLSGKLSYYFNDKLKSSITLQDVLSMTKSPSYNNDILLFHSIDDTIFIVVKHLKLSIIKYSFNSNKAKLISIPSYIPPKCSVFYKSTDKTFFIFSWFDGILYSFTDSGKNVTKLEIQSMKYASESDHSYITVDESNFLYILIPLLRKVRIFDRKGYLVSEFILPIEGFYSDIDLFNDSLVFLNSTNGSLFFFSKRGEELFSYGKSGSVMYPETAEGYQEKQGQLNYPSDLCSTKSFVYVADTGNSRIQILSMDESENNNRKSVTIILQIGSKSAYVDDKRVELDVPPFTKNGRTLVPFRFIGEALDAEVIWNSDTKMASYILDGNRVDVILGSNIAYVNGDQVVLDVAPIIENGRTFVPIRFVTEALGASVIWEANTKKIYITYPGQ